MPVMLGGKIIEGVPPEHFSGAGVPSAGTDEVQILTITCNDGTFRVGYDGWYTAELAHDVSSANLQVALRALPSIAGANVTVAGDAPHTITFVAGLGKLDVPALVTDTTYLLNADTTQGTAVVTIDTPGVTATGRGCSVGAHYTNTATGVDYVNTGTSLAPTWTETSVGAVMPELSTFAGKIPEGAIASVAGLGIAIAAANPTAVAAADPAALAVAIPAAAPAGGVGAAAGGWDTAAHRDAAITTINGLRDDVTEIETVMGTMRTELIDLKARQGENLTELTELKLDITTLSATVVEIKTQLNLLLVALRDAGVVTP